NSELQNFGADELSTIRSDLYRGKRKHRIHRVFPFAHVIKHKRERRAAVHDIGSPKGVYAVLRLVTCANIVPLKGPAVSDRLILRIPGEQALPESRPGLGL